MRVRRSIARAFALVALDVLAARPAGGQEPPAVAPVPDPSPAPDADRPPLGILPTTPEDNLIDPRMARAWSEGPARTFVSTAVDVGYAYARPLASVGYGKPFTSWVGLDAQPQANLEGWGVYGGVRLELPVFSLRFGPRYFFAFNHTNLPLQDSYDRLSLESQAGRGARTLGWEGEAEVALPIGPGDVLARASLTYLTGVPADEAVFEEQLRVIARPPWLWRTRGGYALRFGAYRQHAVGLVADLLDVPRRDDGTTVRAGPIVRFVLSRRVEIRASFIVTLLSPDKIGIVGGDFTELGVRYRWASE